MVFVTLGSQKFQFDRLLKKVDELVADGTICDEVFAQTGYSDYVPQHYPFERFLDREAFSAWVGKSDLVITHGGTGAIIGAVKQGKKVIAVPRLAKYGEHIDDHQLQLLQEFDEMGLIVPCKDPDNLSEAIEEATRADRKSYVSNTERLIADIEQFFQEVLL